MMKVHPISEIFPMMADDELEVLAADIKKNGQRELIYILDDMILDGRNRFKACKLAKVQPKTIHYDGNDPLGFVLSKNLHRRHLNESQRAMVAAKMANLEHGGDRKSDQAADLPSITQRKAADTLNVGERTVRDAKKVIDSGDDEIIEEVEQGKKPVTRAANEVREKEKEKDDPPADPLHDAAIEFCSTLGTYTRQIDAWQKEYAELKKEPLAKFVHWETVCSQLTAVRKAIHQGRPKRRCPYCKATGKKGKADCGTCKGTAHVCESIYRSGVEAHGVPPGETGGKDDE